jgi:hypothetical protein
MACAFMIAVSQYVQFSFSVRVLAMPEQFNCKQVHIICQLLVGVLFPLQLGRRGEAIHYDQSWFGGIIWMWHLVGGSYTT